VVTTQEKERRKVQISGKSSCMVALPKKWVTEMGLRQGSEIVITRPSLGSLLITAEVESPVSAQRDATVEVGDSDSAESVFRKVVSLYVLGYSQISVIGAGPLSSSRRDSIKELVRGHLIGTEGVADARERMTIHVFLGYSELSVDNALKKMLQVASLMHRDAAAALEKSDRDLAEGVRLREDEVGRFGLYVIRQLNMSMSRGISKEDVKEPRDILGYVQVVKAVERIASHACRIAGVVTSQERGLPRPVVSRLSSMSGTAAALVDEAMLSLFKRDNKGADDVVERCEEQVEAESEFLVSLGLQDPKTYHAISAVVESQRRITEYARDIAEVVLDLTVERVLKREPAPYPRAA
jgi:phosphate uptake regulator